MHRGLLLGTGREVNYDFYHCVTPLQLDKLIEGLAAGRKPEEIPVARVNC